MSIRETNLRVNRWINKWSDSLFADLQYYQNNPQESFVVAFAHMRYFQKDLPAVIVLSYLIHICRIKFIVDPDQLYDDDFWMELPVKKMINVCCMSASRIRKAIRTLEDHQIIETDNRTNNRQWIRFTENGVYHVNTRHQ
jgi:hypothetical protein